MILGLLEFALAQPHTMFATEMFGRPIPKKEALFAAGY